MTNEQKQKKAWQMMRQKPIVGYLNIEHIRNSLWDMAETCSEIAYLDNDVILDAFGDDEEMAMEFQTMFQVLEDDVSRMQEDLEDGYVSEYFDTFFVAAGAGSYGGGLFGYDPYQGDYFSIGLDHWVEEEKANKLKRLTKDELISTVQSCLRIMYCYVGLKYRCDCLQTAFDVIRDKALGYIDIIKEIESIYDDMFCGDYDTEHYAERKLDRLAAELPQEVWIM